MPRSSTLSRRVAELHHAAQGRLQAHIDAASLAAAGPANVAWSRLLAVLREPRGCASDTSRCLVILRGLAVATANVLAWRLDRVYRQAHRAAADSVLAAHPLIEDVADDFLALIMGPPDDSLIWRALSPLIRPADWEAIGPSGNRRLPLDLATEIAGGLARGETQRDIAKAVRPYLDGSRVRAARAARTFGLHVAHAGQMDAWGQLGDVVTGYQVHATKSACPPSRTWHQKRDGQIYYRQPGPGQKGLEQMPRPPMEAPDPAERPPGAPRIAWNCKCYLTPVLDLANVPRPERMVAR